MAETLTPNSITGYSRDDLYPDDADMPPWLVEAEQAHGRMVRSTAMLLPDGRSLHVTRFALHWRWTLRNEANPPGLQETDIWLTPEALEASELLIAMLREPGENPMAHLEAYIDGCLLLPR